MKRFLLAILLCILFASSAFAECARLAWDPSTSKDVVGYRFYLKEQVSGTKQKIGEVAVSGTTHPTTTTTSEFVIEGEKGYVIVATALDAKGNESGESNPAYNATTQQVVVFTDTTPPEPPGALQVQERIAKALEDLVQIAKTGIPVRNVE